MKNFKKKMNALMAEAICEAMNSNFVKVGSGAAVLLGSVVNVAATENFNDKLGKIMEDLYGWILGLSTGLAVLLIAWNLVKYMAATDPQTAMLAKKSALRVAGGWLILNLLGTIATVGTSLTKGGKYNGNWS